MNGLWTIDFGIQCLKSVNLFFPLCYKTSDEEVLLIWWLLSKCKLNEEIMLLFLVF